jgi:F0F1-type ATP synthase membrane subunit c/vacuolar-type H+-ATPase subunit K
VVVVDVPVPTINRLVLRHSPNASLEPPRSSPEPCHVIVAKLTRCVLFHRGYMGTALCIIFANWGAAWGTWRSGQGLCAMGVNHPNGIIKNLVAISMAGVLGIYGVIVSMYHH